MPAIPTWMFGRSWEGDKSMALIVDYRSFSDTCWRSIDLRNPEEHLIARETTALLKELLGSLTPRERAVLELKLGYHEPSKTYAEIGRLFDLGSERIRQIYAKSLRKLRHPSRAHILTGSPLKAARRNFAIQ